MALSTKKDQLANIAAVYVTESAANTQTSLKFNFPYSVMDKMAILIARIEYWYSGFGNFNSTADTLTAGIMVAGTVVDISNQADPAIVDTSRLVRVDLGAAASGMFVTQPYIKDFANLPGGGLLVAPAPLYGMVQSAGAAAANACWIKLFYTYMSLSTDQYWELVESRRIISS